LLFLFTACYRLDSGQPFLVSLMDELGFNILSYYVEGENLSRIVLGRRVDFTVTDDIQNLSASFSPKCLIMVR